MISIGLITQNLCAFGQKVTLLQHSYYMFLSKKDYGGLNKTPLGSTIKILHIFAECF